MWKVRTSVEKVMIMAQALEVKQMSTGPSKNFVTIKGTKEGLTIFLDDQCSYETLTKELREKITRDKQVFGNGPEVDVQVDIGYRYINNNQEAEITSLLEEAETIRVKEIRTEVITIEEAKKQAEHTALTSFARIVRSGQVLEVKGDLLLLGDVNPGGTVQATGDIYIMGMLKGTARAGIEGNVKAVVCSAVMDPHQLSIGNTYYYAPERHEKKEKGPLFPEPVYAYIEKQNREITFEKTRLLNQFKRQTEAEERVSSGE
ncbi:septum site-determining protein MinC [Bacillus piscicola]|uniref:septum site-determining protein MinC n=1 Tax=Bacillus piscicola TaxID=1632684 RepID=UPI001F09EFF3|nr:septum site-determining protein MinC [Bacillus piscicola]